MKNKTVIIAEAGVNHQGSIKLAKQMIKEAAKAECNFIKFQVFKADNLVTIKAKKANYQKKFSPNETQYTMLKKLEFDFKKLKELKRVSEKKKINFLCSGFDIEDLKVIKKLNLKILKIPSGEINNLPYLRYAGKNFNKIIISTGLSKLEEIKFAVKTLYKSGLAKKNLTILHCVSSYPAPQNETNLRSINYLKEIFKCKTGLSDHSMGIKIPTLAVTVGAEVIEKHFTLNKKMKGPDHKASLNSGELKKMVEDIRNIEKIMGFSNKIISTSEKKNKFHVRKSIVAKKNIQKGEKFSVENITCKRPANGISPEFWDKVVGKRSNRNYSKDQTIKI